ncbi:uncharacterized protein FIBRA_06832 [Fibroporia radiculosa]|uniref:Microbial-type PARG catalytic domain-containing protein n=1 Tax=Fibroporia radiculosa TaxID=599839 RepID=J4GCM5_9APHY|nr:uncharacterized protein FIBRA_06832 [Fibroporia radiculosa]CCM04648.1 predicted protein [Fibroporia radiculosa]
MRVSKLHRNQSRRAGTPSTPTEYLEAKRIHLKRQRMVSQQRDRKQDAPIHHRRLPIILARVAVKAKRGRWAELAAETQSIVLGDGQYVEERRVSVDDPAVAQLNRQGLVAFEAKSVPLRIHHDISVQVIFSKQSTVFYPHYCEMLAHWAHKRPSVPPAKTILEFSPHSTLTVARRLAMAASDYGLSSFPTPSVGVLSFASSKRPGGGFLHGGNEQEETIARLSSLVASLGVPAAQQFYKEHRRHWAEDGSGLHDHSMLYSPGVVVFRRDGDDTISICGADGRIVDVPRSEDSVGGDFIPPYAINVVASVPVNAAAVRAKHLILPSEKELFEDGIRSAMKERMARILRLFEEQGDKSIVLGAFGCESSQNKVDMVAQVWAELLVCGDLGDEGRRPARFAESFEKVVFAVPGKLLRPFRHAFEMRVFEEQLADATSDLQ